MPPKTKAKAHRSKTTHTTKKSKDDRGSDESPKKSAITKETRGKKKGGKASKAPMKKKSPMSKKGNIKAAQSKAGDAKSPKAKASMTKSTKTGRSKGSLNRAKSKKTSKSKRSVKPGDRRSGKPKLKATMRAESKKVPKASSPVGPRVEPCPSTTSAPSADLPAQHLKNTSKALPRPAVPLAAPPAAPRPATPRTAATHPAAPHPAAPHAAAPHAAAPHAAAPHAAAPHAAAPHAAAPHAAAPHATAPHAAATQPAAPRPAAVHSDQQSLPPPCPSYSAPAASQQQAFGYQGWPQNNQTAQPCWMPQQLQLTGQQGWMPQQAGQPIPGQTSNFYAATAPYAEQQYDPYAASSQMSKEVGVQRAMPAPCQGFYGQQYRESGLPVMQPLDEPLQTAYDYGAGSASQQVPTQSGSMLAPQPTAEQANGTTTPQQMAAQRTGSSAQQLPDEVVHSMSGQAQPFYDASYLDQTQPYGQQQQQQQQQQTPLDAYGNLMGVDGQQQMMPCPLMMNSLSGQTMPCGPFQQIAADQSDPYGTKGGIPGLSPVTCQNETIDSYFQQFDMNNQTENYPSPMQLLDTQAQDPADGRAQ